jgi:ketosteroid isomerase-like protein
MNMNIVMDFVEAINSANVDKIYNLMADDHLFIDSRDNRVVGKENMRQAWIRYFELFPDYKIEIFEILEKDSLICVLGHAGATYKNLKNENNSNYWRIPIACTALVKDNQINAWQVYADNSLVLEIINRNK